MSAIVQAIDQYVNSTPISTGENGHAEYGWSNEIEELIVQFHFQLVRTDKTGVEYMKIKFIHIMNTIHRLPVSSDETKRYLSIMLKLLAQTRDQISGKGEYALSYMMLLEWWNIYPDVAKHATIQIVLGTDIGNSDIAEHQYGSFKDVKYLCQYIYDETGDASHPFIHFCIELLCDRMRKEQESESQKLSLIWRWIPSETSKYSWIFVKLAEQYFQKYLQTAKTCESYLRACLKARMEMRKLRSRYNARLDTVQIKQCKREWATIDHNKTTSITMSRQKRAFLYTDHTGKQRGEDPDRIQCAENLKQYVESRVREGKEIKGARIGMEEFTKKAQNVEYGTRTVEKDIIDSQWRDSLAQTGSLENYIAMVDSSGSMAGDPFNAGVALGIRIAEKSTLGKRVLCFNTEPSWLNLDAYDSFVDMVHCIERDAESKGLSTNFYKALKLVLSAITDAKLPRETVKKMAIVILSDMQMNQGDRSWNNSLYDNIKEEYADAGMKAIGEPYDPPHILFWNLRQTRGFPSIEKHENVSMMSGFSPSLLDVFCKCGIEGLVDMTPYKMLMESLCIERYNCMNIV